MEKEMLQYLSKYISISEELERAITESAFIKSFPKGTILLQKGQISNECFFIIKGCIRSYFTKDGEEKTTELYTEEQAVTPLNYGKKIPSEHYLECLEDVIVSVGTPELEVEMFQKYPQLESLARVIGEAAMANYQADFAEYKMASPEERYLNLLKNRPHLFQRLPQHLIASYLGMKPESLSRIRKRLMNQNE